MLANLQTWAGRRMAGTAEGIAKARAAREAKRTQRTLERLNAARIARGEPARDAAGREVKAAICVDLAGAVGSDDAAPGLVADDAETVVAPAAIAGELVPDGVTENQLLARRIVDEAAPDAAAVLVKLMRNPRVAPNVRASTASRILELAAVGKQSQQSARLSSGSESMFALLSKALEARRRAAQAVDVETVRPA